ncbi:MAG TPA: galactokinase family protein [Pyrinomonadaceae bacterium]|nr:galactokinase family protein [Pyrinomonadaceae bacterium]
MTAAEFNAFNDTAAFLDLLREIKLDPSGLFTSDSLIVTRAPGRLDVMGGIADYSGSLVLPFPIAAATHVAIQLQDEPVIRIHSLSSDGEGTLRQVEMPLRSLMKDDAPVDYTDARAFFKRNPNDAWAAYVAGAFLVLMRERGKVFERGASIFISSAVPEGKGVSSSAALEVASMQAIGAAYDVHLSPLEVALLCQRVENLVAGAPCGVMDQMTSVFGERDHLLTLLCQPAQLNGTIAIPEELGIWGLDSGIRHSVGGADYGAVRTAAFMGYRIIAEVAGDNSWNGYLANISPDVFEQNFAYSLPEQMRGEEFLKQYGGTTDSVTVVKPEQTYHIRRATRHPIHEHARVQSFANILQNWQGLHQAEELGALMYQAHDSYTSCGLNSSGTDELVSLVREIGIYGGLYGARITGGGSGGTVAVLGQRERAPASIARIVETYAQKNGYRPIVISGSSSGASLFGHLRL